MIAVTGATGNVGRPLVQALAAAGEQVTTISRGPSAGDAVAGVQHRQADLSDPDTLRPVLEGADTLFLLVAGEDPHGIVDAAKAGGVKRIVLLSSQGAGTRPEIYRHPRTFEDAVKQSGLDWTILQPGGFDTNTFMWAESVRDQRTVTAPFGDVKLPFIDPADISEVAAVTLRTEGHGGHTYVLTGPAPISPRQQAKAIGEALGTTVRFVEQSRADAKAHLLQFMPEPVVDGTLTVLGEPSAIEQEVSPAVEQLLGRSPHSYADWVARNIAAFR
jgi:uncharacterized protein YbjT (DUF2867 family)